jgi:hypothetical protein
MAIHLEIIGRNFEFYSFDVFDSLSDEAHGSGSKLFGMSCSYVFWIMELMLWFCDHSLRDI